MGTDVLETVPTDTTRLERVSARIAPEDGVATFTSQRPRLVRIATRILGETAEAEDVVQEVWLRWQRTDREAIDNPRAFLATATARVAINVVQSAHHRRETSVTPWLHDMTVVEAASDPATNAERAEAAEQVLGLLLERLSPSERAVFLLRNAFDYPYARIAEVLSLSAANARQLVRRAHLRLGSPPGHPVCSHAPRRLVRAFIAAAQAGEFAELEAVLVAEIGR
jgi:RNA polymerase sigma-70 factor, ECF subfamily